jgi:cytochrome c oxidase cbb3-type subunit 3
MNLLRSTLHWTAQLAALLLVSFVIATAQTPTHTPPVPISNDKSASAPTQYPPALVESGSALFRRDCSFCHGRDAGGGESGPDLTRSRLVTEDAGGNKIGPVVRNGRPDKGMPRFDFSDDDMAGLVAFIHTQQSNAGHAKVGGRKGVDASDLQTGNVEAGKQYFNGAGGCATCHSPTGDLADIASRYQGLELEERMLYPKHVKSKVTVTLASGEIISGTLDYLDEFTVGLIDSAGAYRSWRTSDVQYKVDPRLNAHVELFSKYTDADIHNLMAYLQTLRQAPGFAPVP